MSKVYKKGPYNELCHHLWDSLAPTCTHFSVIQLVPGNSSSLAKSAAERVCSPCIICSGHAWCPGDYLSTSALPLLKAMHHFYAYFHGITYTPYIFTNWCNTQHTKIKTHFILQSLPWFWKTYLRGMLSIQSCTMTQSTCANYMLKSAVP
jgi:hypothetical protein